MIGLFMYSWQYSLHSSQQASTTDWVTRVDLLTMQFRLQISLKTRYFLFLSVQSVAKALDLELLKLQVMWSMKINQAFKSYPLWKNANEQILQFLRYIHTASACVPMGINDKFVTGSRWTALYRFCPVRRRTRSQCVFFRFRNGFESLCSEGEYTCF